MKLPAEQQYVNANIQFSFGEILFYRIVSVTKANLRCSQIAENYFLESFFSEKIFQLKG